MNDSPETSPATPFPAGGGDDDYQAWLIRNGLVVDDTARTVTIDARTERGWVRLELTRDQTVALARQLSGAWR